MPRVLHVSPTYFSDQSIVGGGERYPMELATAMAAQVPTKLLTFGPQRKRFNSGACEVTVLSSVHLPTTGPLARVAFGFGGLLQEADVIHVHQFRCPIGHVAILAARLLHKPVLITDHGGRVRGPFGRSAVARFADGVVSVSAYSDAQWKWTGLPSEVIYGGARSELLQATRTEPGAGFVVVGRILPHKRIDVVIAALPEGASLTIIGRPDDRDYLTYLKRMAKGKAVAFLTDADDRALHEALLSHRALVLASSNRDYRGHWHETPELLGLAVVEGLAAGLPVVVSDLPPFMEVVEDGRTGMIFPRDDVEQLAVKLRALEDDPALAVRLGRNAREAARQRFTWADAVRKCLGIYQVCARW